MKENKGKRPPALILQVSVPLRGIGYESLTTLLVSLSLDQKKLFQSPCGELVMKGR